MGDTTAEIFLKWSRPGACGRLSCSGPPAFTNVPGQGGQGLELQPLSTGVSEVGAVEQSVSRRDRQSEERQSTRAVEAQAR